MAQLLEALVAKGFCLIHSSKCVSPYESTKGLRCRDAADVGGCFVVDDDDLLYLLKWQQDRMAGKLTRYEMIYPSNDRNEVSRGAEGWAGVLVLLAARLVLGVE